MHSRWIALGVVGLLVIGLFLFYVFGRKQPFDGPLLGLLTLGLLFLGVGILQPDSIKYGDFELKRVRENAIEATNEAKDASKLALESAAVAIWNQGRFGGGPTGQEEIATKLLKQLYGDKALPYRYYLQHEGLLLTPKEQLRSVPEVKKPDDIDSPLYQLFIGEFTGGDRKK